MTKDLYGKYVAPSNFEVSLEDIQNWKQWFFDQFGELLKIKNFEDIASSGIEIGVGTWNQVLEVLEWFRKAFVVSSKNAELQAECEPMFNLLLDFKQSGTVEQKKRVLGQMQKILKEELAK